MAVGKEEQQSCPVYVFIAEFRGVSSRSSVAVAVFYRRFRVNPLMTNERDPHS